MKKKFEHQERRGLPGGPNEMFTYVTGVFSTEGYKRNSPDVNNPYNIIPSGNITMEDVDFPVHGVDNLGNEQIMIPGNDYQFPGDMVFETPMAQKGYEVPKRQGVRKNPDGTESTHLMATETLDGKNWFSFPTLFQDPDGTWIDMSDKPWKKAYEEAKRRGEVIEFGTDKEAAIKFGEGSWKPKMKRGGGLLTKTMKCNSCGWSWKAADGGNDVTTCHKCGGEALPKAQNGDEPKPWEPKSTIDPAMYANAVKEFITNEKKKQLTGAALEAHKRNPELQKKSKAEINKEWIKNWIKTRNATGKFEDQLGNGQMEKGFKSLDDVKKVSREEMVEAGNDDASYWQMGPPSGMYVPSNNIYFSDPGFFSGNTEEDTDVHEQTHVFDIGTSGVPKKDMTESIPETNIHKAIKNIPVKGKYKTEDYLPPAEVYAELMKFRKKNNIDPNKIFTKYDLLKLRKKLKKENEYNLYKLIDIYNDEGILRLMNEVAAINAPQENNIGYAQYGDETKPWESKPSIDPAMYVAAAKQFVANERKKQLTGEALKANKNNPQFQAIPQRDKDIETLKGSGINPARLYMKSDDQGSIDQYVEPEFEEQALNYLANPMTTLGYLARGEDLPNFVPDKGNVIDNAMDVINPFAYLDYGDKAYDNLSNDEYAQAGFNLLAAIPFLPKGGKAVKGLAKTPTQLPGSPNALRTPSELGISDLPMYHGTTYKIDKMDPLFRQKNKIEGPSTGSSNYGLGTYFAPQLGFDPINPTLVKEGLLKGRLIQTQEGENAMKWTRSNRPENEYTGYIYKTKFKPDAKILRDKEVILDSKGKRIDYGSIGNIEKETYDKLRAAGVDAIYSKGETVVLNENAVEELILDYKTPQTFEVFEFDDLTNKPINIKSFETNEEAQKYLKEQVGDNPRTNQNRWDKSVTNIAGNNKVFGFKHTKGNLEKQLPGSPNAIEPIYRGIYINDEIRNLPKFKGKSDDEILNIMGTEIPGNTGTRRKKQLQQTLNFGRDFDSALEHIGRFTDKSSISKIGNTSDLTSGKMYILKVQPDDLPFISAEQKDLLYKQTIDAWRKNNPDAGFVLGDDAKNINPELLKQFGDSPVYRTEGVNVIKGNFPQFTGLENTKIGKLLEAKEVTRQDYLDYLEKLKINSKPINKDIFKLKNENITKAGFDGNFITRPLTLFTKNELTKGEHLYRKIGGKKGLEDLISKQGAQAPAPIRMKSGLTADTPFFGIGKKPNENYSGIFAVETNLPSASKYNWSNRVAGTTNYGVAPFDKTTGASIKNIPLDDLEVFRKKWFSNSYRKLDKQNLQKELKSANLQELSEKLYKWGIRGYLADQILNDGDLTGGKAIEIIEKHFENTDSKKYGGSLPQAQDGIEPKDYTTFVDTVGLANNETSYLEIYKNYIDGVYDNTSEEKQAQKIYDKLNRVYYKEAKANNMTVPNYIMSNIISKSL